MRTVLITFAILALAPATAFADDAKSAPHVVLTIDNPTQPQTQTPTPPPTQTQTQTRPPKAVPSNNGGYVVPESVSYDGGKIPEGASLEKRPNMTLVATGLSILGVTYLSSVISAAASCPPQSACTATSGATWLYLPFAGPFITAAMATSTGGMALAAFDGGLQILGGALALAGVLAPKKFVVWQTKSASLKITTGTGAGPLVSDAKPAMSAGLSLTLTHL